MAKKWLNEEAIDILCDYYYPRAKWLQDNVNWGPLDYEGPEANEIINDPLLQKIDIYDCGASFENDHGYRNNCIQYWGTQYGKLGINEMCQDLIDEKAKGPIFTSIGNQPPAPKKGTSNVDFMTKELPQLIYGFTDWLLYEKIDGKEMKTHTQIVDYLNHHNALMGHRKFNFQYSAFSMDCSDYYPTTVDVDSHCYLGNNAVRCMQKMSSGYSSDEFMDLLRERTGGKPKDLEDVMCDFIRFGQNYVPRGNGTFDHITSTITNNSGWESGWRQRQGEQPELNNILPI